MGFLIKCIFLTIGLVTLIVFATNALDGFASCAETPDFCENICKSQPNPLANLFDPNNTIKPSCNTTDGVCHCYIQRPPNTATKFRPPNRKEENCSKSCTATANGAPMEYGTVYVDKAKQQSNKTLKSVEMYKTETQKKYCVCFSVLKP